MCLRAGMVKSTNLLALFLFLCGLFLSSARPLAQYPLYPRIQLPVPYAQRAPADRAAAFAKGLPTPSVSAVSPALQAFSPPGTVSVVNGVFALNGSRRFLLFVSYFGGLRDAVLHPDWLIGNLDAAKQLGFDGIRVFPNWWWNLDGTCNPVDAYPLVKGDGSFNFDPLVGVPAIPPSWLYQPPGGSSNSVAGRLQFLLDVAWEKGLVVELALAGETSATAGQRLWDGNNPVPSTQKYRNALKNLAAGLSTLQFFGDSSVSPPSPPQTGYRHVIFDVWNEANIGIPAYPWCKPVLPGRTPSNAGLPLDTNQPSIANFASAVKEGDPLRLVTGSLAGDILSPNAATYWANSNISYAGHHDPRSVLAGFQWWQATRYTSMGTRPPATLGGGGFPSPESEGSMRSRSLSASPNDTASSLRAHALRTPTFPRSSARTTTPRPALSTRQPRRRPTDWHPGPGIQRSYFVSLAITRQGSRK